jgi:hypothetical protein
MLPPPSFCRQCQAAAATTTTLLPRCSPPPRCHRCRRRAAAKLLLPPPNDVTFDAYQPNDIVFYAYFLSGVKKIEIGFTQNNLSIRVRSVRLEFLLPPKTNYFSFRCISLKYIDTLEDGA